MAKTRSCDDYLPEDIIFVILSWVPVKALIRFKSVCKSWRFMISNTQFIQNHLTNSQKRQAAVLLKYKDFNAHIDVQDTHQHSYRLYLPPHVTNMNFIYSCDGLVCLSNFHCDVIYIWNPSTKRLKMLPTPNKDLSGWRVILGLGFDSISNDYKLLRIAIRLAAPGAEAELYSSNANSWKDIQIPETVVNLFKVRLSKIVHVKPGILYLRGNQKLLAFDLHNEVFRLYQVPYYAMSCILDFEGYIAMVLESGDGSVPSLFVLNDVCGKVSWTKLFNLEGNVKISTVIQYLGFGQFVVRIQSAADSDKLETCYYDYKKRETQNFPLKLLSVAGTRSIIKYTESLVSLNGFQRQDESGV